MGKNGSCSKGKILLIQPFTAKAFCPDLARESNLGEAIQFESMDEYERWLADDNSQPKMTRKEKELFEPVMRMR